MSQPLKIYSFKFEMNQNLIDTAPMMMYNKLHRQEELWEYARFKIISYCCL